MPTPLNYDSSTAVQTGNANSHPIVLPACLSGQLLWVAYAFDGAPTVTWDQSSAGTWTVGIDTANGTSCKLVVAYKVADGTEGGVTLTPTTNNAEQSVARAASVYNWEGTIGSGLNLPAAATGASTTPDPPAATDSWGTVDRRTIAIEGCDGGRTVSAYPTNYDTNQFNDSSGGGAGCGLGSAAKDGTEGSQDPGTFTISASDQWVAVTLSLRGGTAGEPSDDGSLSLYQPPPEPAPDDWYGGAIGFRVDAGPSILEGTVDEIGSAAETPSALAIYAASLTETGAGVDTPSATADFVASLTETGTAADTPSVTLTTVASIAEGGGGGQPLNVSRIDFGSDATDLTTYTDTLVVSAGGGERTFFLIIGARATTAGRTLSSASLGGATGTIEVQRTIDDGSNSTMAAVIRFKASDMSVPTATSLSLSLVFSGAMIRAHWDCYETANAVDPTPHATASDDDAVTGGPMTAVLSLNVAAGGAVMAGATCGTNGGQGAVAWTGLTENGGDQVVENNLYSVASLSSGSVESPRTIQADFTDLDVSAPTVVGVAVSFKQPPGSVATETQDATISLDGTVAESGSAADSSSTTATFSASTAETGSAAETQSTTLTAVASIAEAGAASDTHDATQVSGDDSETRPFLFDDETVDLSEGLFGAIGFRIDESAIIEDTVAEIGAAVDSPSVVAIYAAAITETGAAVESESTTAIFAASTAETGSASDTQDGSIVGADDSETRPFVPDDEVADLSEGLFGAIGFRIDVGAAIIDADLTETASAVESQSATGTYSASLSESGSASDSHDASILGQEDSETRPFVFDEWDDETLAQIRGVVAFEILENLFSGTVDEVASAADTQTAAATTGATVAESAAASDTQSVTRIVAATVTETAAAADTSDGITGIFVDTAETLEGVDTVNATAVMGVSVSESAAASDAQTGDTGLLDSVAETANAFDGCDATITYTATVAESGAAADTTSVTVAFSPSIVESGVALETITTVAVFSATVAETAPAVDFTNGALPGQGGGPRFWIDLSTGNLIWGFGAQQ